MPSLWAGETAAVTCRTTQNIICNAKSTTGCYYCQCFKNPRPSLTPTDRGPVQTSLTGGYGRNRPDVVRPRYPYRAGTRGRLTTAGVKTHIKTMGIAQYCQNPSFRPHPRLGDSPCAVNIQLRPVGPPPPSRMP